ncbi:MAG: hypothetical protein KKB51_15530 [Candidatus Riflebacteria bacterium]|nr:hypothetical protein [Candidatus Riflebacteria bacterium]
MKKIITVMFLVLSFASQVVAEPAKFIDNNAALRYLMAIGFMPQLSENTAYKLADVDSLESLKNLKPEIRKELSTSTAVNSMVTISRLLDLAAECTESTFVVDQNYDEESIVPPYRSLRQFARFMNARAWIDAEKGDYAAAARKFVHIFRLGANLGREGIAISGMVGIGIQRIAVESINNMLELSQDREIKKMLHDYFSALPKPLIASGLFIDGEKLYITNTLAKADKKPEVLGDLVTFKDSSAEPAQRQIASNSACVANQRVLMGAVEMYLMDYDDVLTKLDTATILTKLVEEKYLLKAPVCPNKGKYIISFQDKEEFDVSCSCGMSPDMPVEAQSVEATSSAVMEKASAYVKSDAYAKDKKELFAIFDEILTIDAYSADSDEKASKLAERIEKSPNPLIEAVVINPKSFYKSLRENQQRIDDLVKKLSQ